MGRDPYRELFERSADAILIIEDGKFVDCNQATVEMLRYANKADLLRTHPSELSPPTQPDGRDSFGKADEMMAIAFAQGSHRFEWDHRRFDGEVFPVEVLLTAVERDGKQILHVVWRDIADRKRLESQLLHSQRIEAIGKLTGGIAHDFNNLLVAILGNAELLQDEIGSQPRAGRYIDEIMEAGRRAATLVGQLLTFSRKRDAPAEVTDLVPVLRDVHSMLTRLIGEHITLTVSVPETAIPSRVGRDQLEQLVMNLITNARDAMSTGGTVALELRTVALSVPDEDPLGSLAPGSYAVISVSDTGSGMSEEIRTRAIEPFFTTKEVGAGTGLGLSSVYGVAQSSGGGLRISSVVGRGTQVDVYLPLTSQMAIRPSPVARRVSVVGGNERVLVVEDEDAVASVVQHILASHGYAVQRARNGVEALVVCLDPNAAPQLVLSDVVMPKMGGLALFEALRGSGSRIPMVFMSGYTGSAMHGLAEHAVEIQLLAKPFTADQLLIAVRDALDQGRE